MMQQAWGACLFRKSLKLHQFEWETSVHSHVQILVEMFNQIQSDKSEVGDPGWPLTDI